ncbi:hypothetical protein QIW31_07660 [Francisellaceae bacterium CB299]
MKFLRNHIQHNGLLLDRVNISERNLQNSDRESTIKVFKKKNNIKARGYNSEKFQEFEDEINLKTIIRQYIDEISGIHKIFRQRTESKKERVSKYFDLIFKEYNVKQYLEIVVKDNSSVDTRIVVTRDSENLIEKMVKKNQVPTFFKKQYISTKL